jgi:hypothetical protein
MLATTQKAMATSQEINIMDLINLLKEIGKKITEQHTKHYEERKEFLNAEIKKRQEWLENYEEKRRQIAGKNNISYYEAVRYISKGENEECDTHSKFIPSLESERNRILQFTLPKYKRLSFQSTMHEFQGIFQKDIIDFKNIDIELQKLKSTNLQAFFIPFVLLPESNSKNKILHNIGVDLLKIMTLYFTTWGADSKEKEVQNWLESFLQAYSYYGINEGIKEFLKSDKASADYFKLQSLIPFIEKHHKEGLVLIANINWLLETSAETKRIN